MGTDLAEFVLARVAEDEAAARACVGPDWETGLPATIHPDPTTYRTVMRRVGHVCGSIIAADAEHIARHDPARVLAECEAKKAIVEAYIAERDADHRWEQRDIGYEEGLRTAVELLALPYADHPDYDERWRP